METDRITLRFARSGDATWLHEHYLGDYESARFLARRPHQTEAQTRTLLNRLSTPESLETEGKVVWVIHEKVSSSAIGLVTVVRVSSGIELHFGIGYPFRGLGYGAEALALAARHLTSSGQADSVTVYTDIDHKAAQAAIENAGFYRLGILEQAYSAPQLNHQVRSAIQYQWGGINPTRRE